MLSQGTHIGSGASWLVEGSTESRSLLGRFLEDFTISAGDQSFVFD